MNGIENTKKETPILKNDERMYVYLQGNHFQQNNVLTSNNDHVINKNVINIYIVYKLDPLASNRDKSFIIQNALFGAVQITENATDNSKNNYKGYGICFDERGEFGHTITEGGRAHTTDARNVLIFGADMSSSVHATNRANHIYLMGTGLTQGINDTTKYVEKNFYRNFTDFGKKFVLSLHYNGDNSYLFVNGRQELKFKAKTDQLVKGKLCIGNLSDQWTTSESEKTGRCGKIYDFVVDYEQISGVKVIYDMHRYLMTKHNITPQKQYYKMSYYPPYKSSSNNVKVELDLTNYATKTDLKNITDVDVSSFASKTNLAALKTEVNKIDADKLKAVPFDLAKLSNVVKNQVVKKTDYSTKITIIESQIAGLTKNTVDNLADITKLKAVDTNNFALKTKLASDVTTLENKIDSVDKKIPDINGLATKTSLNDYLQISTFNSKVTEVENKIKANDTKANTIRSDLTGYA